MSVCKIRTCSVDGCNRKHKCRGLCQMHWDRQKRDHPCTVDGCDRKQNRRGLCHMHLRRVQRHGSTDTVHARTAEEKHAKIRTHGKALSERDLRRLRKNVGLPPDGPTSKWHKEQSFLEHSNERVDVELAA